MDTWEIDEVRRRADQGEPVELEEVRALIAALEATRGHASIPAEFIVRVHRDEGLRWRAEHPVLKVSCQADHPADALILASSELRRSLSGHAWPDTAPPRRRWGPNVSRIEAEAIANTADLPAGAALSWALEELNRVSAELSDLKYVKFLSTRADAGDQQARDELRHRALDQLAAANVRGATNGWSTDGFGDAQAVGLALPTLALAINVHDNSVDGWTFDARRPWHALTHRVEPRPMSRYESAIVSPVMVGPAAELALRRTAPRVPLGDTIGVYAAFGALMAEEFPSLDIGTLNGRLSPSWFRLPLESLAMFTDGPTDAALDLAAVADYEGFGPFPDRWQLVWITDEAEAHCW